MKQIGIIILLFIVSFVGISIGAGTAHLLSANNPSKQVLPAHILPQKDSAKEPAIELGIPQTLRIPKINVQATVESVGLDTQGRMDIPRKVEDVAWYNLGYKPGEKGNAVIDGHLDKVTGAPAVFWNLSKLTAGDKIFITDSKGHEYTFSVLYIRKYPYNNFPIEEVFGASSKSRLNLITCQGVWNSAQRNYSHRVVAFSELVD